MILNKPDTFLLDVLAGLLANIPKYTNADKDGLVIFKSQSSYMFAHII